MLAVACFFVSALFLGTLGYGGLWVVGWDEAQSRAMRTLKETVDPFFEVLGEIGVEGVQAALEYSAQAGVQLAGQALGLLGQVAGLAVDLLVALVEGLGWLLGVLFEGLAGACF